MHTTHDQDALAARFAKTPPHTALERLQVAHLSTQGLLDALTATHSLIAHAQALHLRVLAVLNAQRTDDPLDCTEDEITAALRWPPNTTRARLDLAGALTDRFPETLDLMHTGRATWPQADALVDLTSHLEPDAARTVQARVLERMPEQSTAATRKALHRAVLAADPHGAEKRHQQAAKRRRIELYPEPDGMATLTLYTPAPTGTAIMAALDQHAKPRPQGDQRTLDQRRADTLTTLILDSVGVPRNGTQGTDTTVPVPALVHVTIGIDTLLGTNHEPADLTGYGPISAGQARALAFAEGSLWRRLLTAPDGALLHTDPTTYRPTASVERLVRARDRHCTFPGCQMPAQRCDVDHIQPYNHDNPETGGATTPENLQALCRRHHRMKTAGSWSVQRADHAHTTWTSTASGRTYETHAPTYAAAA